MKKRICIFILIVFTGCFLSCENHRKKEIKNTVRTYQELLIDALERPDPELMNRITGVDEKIRIQQYILYLRKHEKVLSSELNNLEFLIVNVKSPKKAIVKTSEDWTYRYLDRETKERLEKDYDIHYRSKYVLKKEDKNWIVSELVILNKKGDELQLKSKSLEKSGERG